MTVTSTLRIISYEMWSVESSMYKCKPISLPELSLLVKRWGIDTIVTLTLFLLTSVLHLHQKEMCEKSKWQNSELENSGYYPPIYQDHRKVGL